MHPVGVTVGETNNVDICEISIVKSAFEETNPVFVDGRTPNSSRKMIPNLIDHKLQRTEDCLEMTAYTSELLICH
jgi:hypothetical protein